MKERIDIIVPEEEIELGNEKEDRLAKTYRFEPVDRIRFAAATAAIKATRGHAEKGIPDRSAVEVFLEDRI